MQSDIECTQCWCTANFMELTKGKGMNKVVRPVTGHEGPDREWSYRHTLEPWH